MARTEEQLRAYYGEHPPEGARCTDAECVQCEMRDLLATIDGLRASLKEMRTLAMVSFEGDPWYAQQNGYDEGRMDDLLAHTREALGEPPK